MPTGGSNAPISMITTLTVADNECTALAWRRLFSGIATSSASRLHCSLHLVAELTIFQLSRERLMTPLTPLRFEPILREYLWGGRRLGTELGKPIGNAERYAES